MPLHYFSRRSALLLAFSVFALLLSACGGGGGGGDESGGDPGVVGISQTGSTNSHTDGRRGTDCMGCHTSGPGTGVFITAGTTRASNGFVEYYADMARTILKAKLQVDGYGNFYTVTAIDILTPNAMNFSQGAYVTIVSSSGARRNMSGVISHTTAGCNFCHRSGGLRSPL